jgi:snoRNA binding domain-containing protein (fibrillarin)
LDPGTVVRTGSRIHLVPPEGRVRTVPLTGQLDTAVAWQLGDRKEAPPGLRQLLEGLPASAAVGLDDPMLARALVALGRPVVALSLRARRAAREKIRQQSSVMDREYVLQLARASVERALADPVEALISLAREEERVERSVRREENAAQHFPRTGPVATQTYVARSIEFREQLGEHYAGLRAGLESLAVATAPNLSKVVGAQVAGRLIAAAGGIRPLARMTAARIQLLGARRRPSGQQGPRFGLLFRSVRMNELPVGAQGPYARSLAALAAIAARADALTQARIGAALAERRDRRVAQLLRERR